MRPAEPAPVERAVVVMAGGALLVGTLIWAKSVLIPIAIAILLSFALGPLVARVQRWGVSRTWAATLVVVAGVLGFLTLAYLIQVQTRDLIGEIPQIGNELARKLHGPEGGDSGGGKVQILLKSLTEQNQAKPSGARDQPYYTLLVGEASYLPGWALPAVQAMGSIFLVLGLTTSMLLKREDLRNRLLRLVGVHRLTQTTRALEEASKRISTYLFAHLTMNAIYGSLLGVGLWVIGVPNGLIWGVMGGLLRFIPLLGVWIAAAPPLIVAAGKTQTDWGLFDPASMGGWGLFIPAALWIVGLIVAINSFVEPMLVSRGTGVSSLALVVSAIFWTWVWGPVGLVMATPITVCLAVLGRLVPQMKGFDVLLGNSPALEAKHGFYQRLLARDEAEASEVFEEYSAEHGAEKIAEEIVLPTLRQVRDDLARAELGRDDLEAIAKLMSEIMTAQRTVRPGDAAPPAFRVLGLPARDDLDRVAIETMQLVFDAHPSIGIDIIGEDAVASEMVGRVLSERPNMVLVSVVPPEGLTQARYLVKRLRASLPDLPIAVVCWGLDPGLRPEWSEKLFQVGTTEVHVAMAEVRQKLGERSHLTRPVSLDEVRPLAAVDGQKGASRHG